MRKLLYLIAVVALFSSCRTLRPNLMLKTPKNYTYEKIVDSMRYDDYKVSSNDAIVFRLFTNDGFKMIDLTANGQLFNSNIDETVDKNGNLKLPLLGYVKVAGLTLREVEIMLEDKYSKYYKNPYVTLKISNKRITVFPGSGGAAKVVPINNNNTTVLEALALAGGITDDGKAYKIKLVRNSGPTPKVYLLDLSVIEGLPAGNSIVQANDIIYVESRVKFAQRLAAEVLPYISILSTTLLIYNFIKK